jgi:hypothetical protein
MNLDEYKAYVLATRKASQLEAMSVLSDTITNSNPKEGK